MIKIYEIILAILCAISLFCSGIHLEKQFMNMKIEKLRIEHLKDLEYVANLTASSMFDMVTLYFTDRNKYNKKYKSHPTKD